MRKEDAPRGAVPLNLDVEDIFEQPSILYLKMFAKVGNEVINGLSVSNYKIIYNECKYDGVVCSCNCGVTKEDAYICLKLKLLHQNS